MSRRWDGSTSTLPENIVGQSLSVGFRPLPQTTPIWRVPGFWPDFDNRRSGDASRWQARCTVKPEDGVFRVALRVIERYRIHVPEHVLKYLNDPVSETPKSGNPCFANSRLVMASKPADMVAAVAAEARTRGFDVISLGADIEGEARTVGAEHGRMALEIAEKKEASRPPVLIVSGGETTVSVRNAAGRGGRNLEYLLSLAITVEGSKEISALACDTDGLDGSEDNAGAILDAETLQRARYAGLDPHKALTLNESYSIFKASDGLVITGPTRTNVNDIRLIKID